MIMRRIVDSLISSARLQAILLCILAAYLHGCAVMNSIQNLSSPYPIHPETDLERNRFSLAKGSDVIGRLAVVRLENGDTIPDIARHFSLGINEVSAANPGVDIWVPEAGKRIMLPLQFILPDAPRKGIVINLATMRLFHYRTERGTLTVTTYPVGVGTAERPTPTGQMYVARKVTRPTWYVPASIAEDHRKKGDPLPPAVGPGPLNPLGEYALYLSKSTYLIHGTNKPASIGLNATNGCLRLYPEDVKRLYENTPVNTPVVIVNQPYLIGHRNGTIYLEAHAALEGSGADEPEKVYGKLRTIERSTKRSVDWKKVEKVLAEAKGIPVPILETGNDAWVEQIIEVEHPEKLYGTPEMPQPRTDAWYVWAADIDDRTQALRIAAIINHQGPPIPARVLSRSNGYRIVAGPYNDVSEARDALRRLKIDLEIDGVLIEPAKQKP